MAKRQTAVERYRASKKVEAVSTMTGVITRLRHNYRRDMNSGDERLQYTALAVAMIDKTSERVGNSGSGKKGHYGITSLQACHVTVSGNQIRLHYIGKSGVQQDKRFSDPDMAKLVRARLRRGKYGALFKTSRGFIVKADKVNRYLAPFGITAKDIRGHHANKYMVLALRQFRGQLHGEKERKRAFLAQLKRVANKVGHQPATLRKHYLLPSFEANYVKYGRFPNV